MSNHGCIFFTTVHYFKTKDVILLSTVKNTESKLFDCSDLHFTQVLLFDHFPLDVNTNSSILNATIEFVISFKWFEEPTFPKCRFFFNTVPILFLFCILFPFILIFLGHYIYACYFFFYFLFFFMFWFNPGALSYSWYLVIVFLSYDCMW